MARKTVPDPGFAGDDGSADPALLAALRSGDDASIVAALATARLFVPVMARATDEESGSGGLRREKASEIALVLIKASSGLTALPAFTSVDALTAWRAEARPVPAYAQAVAASVLAELADLVVIDPSGPVTAELTGPALWAVAEGRPLLPPAEDLEVADALRAAAEAEDAVAGVRVEAATDPRTDLCLRLVPHDGVAPADLREAVRRIAARLATSEILRVRVVRGIEIAPAER